MIETWALEVHVTHRSLSQVHSADKQVLAAPVAGLRMWRIEALGSSLAMHTHQDGAALEVYVIHDGSGQGNGLGGAVVEAPQAVPDAVDAVLGHPIVCQGVHNVLHHCGTCTALQVSGFTCSKN